MAQQQTRDVSGIAVLAHVALAGSLIVLAMRLGTQLLVPLAILAPVAIVAGTLASRRPGYARATTIPMLVVAAAALVGAIVAG